MAHVPKFVLGHLPQNGALKNGRMSRFLFYHPPQQYRCGRKDRNGYRSTWCQPLLWQRVISPLQWRIINWGISWVNKMEKNWITWHNLTSFTDIELGCIQKMFVHILVWVLLSTQGKTVCTTYQKNTWNCHKTIHKHWKLLIVYTISTAYVMALNSRQLIWGPLSLGISIGSVIQCMFLWFWRSGLTILKGKVIKGFFLAQ